MVDISPSANHKHDGQYAVLCLCCFLEIVSENWQPLRHDKGSQPKTNGCHLPATLVGATNRVVSQLAERHQLLVLDAREALRNIVFGPISGPVARMLSQQLLGTAPLKRCICRYRVVNVSRHLACAVRLVG